MISNFLMVVFSRVLCIFLSLCVYLCQRLCNIVFFWLLWYEDCEYSVCGVLWICAYTAVMDQTIKPMFKSFFEHSFQFISNRFPAHFYDNLTKYQIVYAESCMRQSFVFSLTSSLTSLIFVSFGRLLATLYDEISDRALF